MRFDIGLMHRFGLELVFDDLVRFRETGLDVADFEGDVTRHIGRLGRGGLDAARNHVVEQQRRVRRHRLVDIDDMRQDLVVDLDQRERLVRDRDAGRRHGGDGVSVIQRLFAGHDIPGDMPEIDLNASRADIGEILIREVGGGHHRLDARQGLGLGRIDRLDFRVRMRAAKDLAV